VKNQRLVATREIKDTDSVILVEVEKQLIAELYEMEDFPRDFRVRIVHRETPLTQTIVVEVHIDVIDPTNPRVDVDLDWFKRNSLPTLPPQHTKEEEAKLRGWGLDKTYLDETIDMIYGEKIREQLKADDLRKYLTRFNSMQWAGGDFAVKVSAQMLAKAKDPEIIIQEAIRAAHESMIDKAISDGVPKDLVDGIQCHHKQWRDHSMFAMDIVCSAQKFVWVPESTTRPPRAVTEDTVIKFRKYATKDPHE
jgi:hypothetical protein